MILLTFVHDRTSARAPSDTRRRANLANAESQRGGCLRLRGPSAYLPGRSLLLSPGVCPCFAPTPLMYERCLYPAKTAVAFYSVFLGGRAGTQPTPCAGGWAARLRSAVHVTKWRGRGLGERVFPCSLRGGGGEMEATAWTDWHAVWPLYSRRRSAPFTSFGSHQLHSASHQPLRAIARAWKEVLCGWRSRLSRCECLGIVGEEEVLQVCAESYLVTFCFPFSRQRVKESKIWLDYKLITGKAFLTENSLQNPDQNIFSFLAHITRAQLLFLSYLIVKCR